MDDYNRKYIDLLIEIKRIKEIEKEKIENDINKLEKDINKLEKEIEKEKAKYFLEKS